MTFEFEIKPQRLSITKLKIGIVTSTLKSSIQTEELPNLLYDTLEVTDTYCITGFYGNIEVNVTKEAGYNISQY